MKDIRISLWLILVSQLIFLLSSLIEPPQAILTIIVRLFGPLIVPIGEG